MEILDIHFCVNLKCFDFFLIFMSCAKRIMHTFAYWRSVARCLSVVLVALIVVVCIKRAL